MVNLAKLPCKVSAKNSPMPLFYLLTIGLLPASPHCCHGCNYPWPSNLHRA